MLEIAVPGCKNLSLSHLVLDYNGTIACDGSLIGGVEQKLLTLSADLELHVLTADTFGTVKEQLAQVDCRLSVIPKADQAQAKRSYVQGLRAEYCVSVGNGRNDGLMLREAALGIAVLQKEGLAVEAVLAADVVVTSILEAFDLLLQPLRLTASLRS